MQKVEVMVIPSSGALDSITVFWEDFDVSKGQVTITCWGSAWTCYFGGMGANTIKEFFASADTSYLVSKLGCTQWLVKTKRHEAYFGRIVDAIKTYLKSLATLSVTEGVDGSYIRGLRHALEAVENERLDDHEKHLSADYKELDEQSGDEIYSRAIRDAENSIEKLLQGQSGVDGREK